MDGRRSRVAHMEKKEKKCKNKFTLNEVVIKHVLQLANTRLKHDKYKKKLNSFADNNKSK